MKEKEEKTIKQYVEEEIQGKLFTYTHKFQHYSFQMELHPDDSREEMENQLKNIHGDKDS